MAAACSAVPVRAFPTWVFGNGQVIEGELDFDTLEGLLDVTAPGGELAAPAADVAAAW